MRGRTITFVDGDWVEGNPPLIGPVTHAMWMSSIVFDGARAFEGTAPDLSQHCERLQRSATVMGLQPTKSAEEIEGIARDGIARHDPAKALYVQPMYYATTGFIMPDAESTQFVMAIFEADMPPASGFGAKIATMRRPTPETAPTMAKASCLYPLGAMALREATAAGYQNAILCDMLGNVAEFATANIMMVKDGAVHTPIPNGTFLDGVTRRRVIQLLRDDGVTVIERTIRPEELAGADEIFSTGNFGKVVPCIRIDGTDFQPGPVARQAKELYWAYAHDVGKL